MTKILSFFILISLMLSCGSSKEGSGVSKSEDIIGENYLTMINSHRKSIGSRSLIYLKDIEKVAYGHSSNMAKKKVPFGHLGWRNRCKELKNKTNSTACSEIVAKGQKTESEVFRSWLSSSDHKKSIENPDYTHTGIAKEKSSTGVIYWTEIFLRID